MLRHNTLRGYEVMEQTLAAIWTNRLILVGASLVLVLLSAWVLSQKRKGRFNAAHTYREWFSVVKSKLGFSRKG